jgi:putative peptide zinc metalloprotease protein
MSTHPTPNAASSQFGAAAPGPTFSDQWYRVATLHPRLLGHVRMLRHSYRGDIWHVLHDPVTGRQHRINPVAWALVARLDGQQSLRQIWDTVVAEQGSQAPTQPEVLALLGQLHQNALIASENAPDLKGLFSEHERRSRREKLAGKNPLSWRVSLGNPTVWLTHSDGLGRLLFSTPAAWLWLALVAWALVAAGMHAPALQTYAARHLGSPLQLVLLWLAYPLIKALHEAAHAMAVRRWGGDVSEMGITLMLLVPVPYVDASAANAFTDRRHRVLVSLAGMAVEAALAALALALWLVAADGVVREAAFAVMLIGGVSTLLFNGNPLVRMDAYHALADWLESPGLAQRSSAYWMYLARRWLLGLSQTQAPTVALREKRWLLSYGAAAALYQWLLALWIVSWLLAQSLVLGVLVLAWFVATMVVWPAVRVWRWARSAAELAQHRNRALGAGAALALAPLLLLTLLPLPAYTRAQGVVWLPDLAVARVQTDGFVDRVLAQDGAWVEPGTPLLLLSDPTLQADEQALLARWRGTQAAQLVALRGQTAQVNALAQQLTQLRADAEQMDQRRAQLTLRAGAAGRLALARAADLPGAWLARGTVVAHVLPAQGAQVRVVVPQDDIARLQPTAPATARLRQPTGPGAAAPRVLDAQPDQAVQAVEVRLAHQLGQTQVARVLSQTPAAGHELPSAILGDSANGPFAIDPTDSKHQRTLEPVFTLDLDLPQARSAQPGTRAWVRFDHGAQPLAWQWLYRVRQLFIGRLTAST